MRLIITHVIPDDQVISSDRLLTAPSPSTLLFLAVQSPRIVAGYVAINYRYISQPPTQLGVVM